MLAYIRIYFLGVRQESAGFYPMYGALDGGVPMSRVNFKKQ